MGKNRSELVNKLILGFTSLCTILGFLRLFGEDIITARTAIYCLLVAVVVFLLVIISLNALFLIKIDKLKMDGRSILFSISAALSIFSILLYNKPYPENIQAGSWVDRIGLIAILTSLLVFLFAIAGIFAKWLSNFIHAIGPRDFQVDSVNTTLVRVNKRTFQYDTYKHIQVDQPVLTFHDIKVSWTGDPIDKSKVSSSLQNVTDFSKDSKGYDRAQLTFLNPLQFRDSATLHLHINLTNNCGKAESYLSSNVKKEDPISSLCLKVVLLDVKSSYNKEALWQSRKLDGPNDKFDTIKKIAFDKETKSYSICVPNPEPDHQYRIFWGD